MEMHHFMKDLYPNMGFEETATSTIADPDDQHALVDDQKLATEYQVKEDPFTGKKIGLAILALLAVMFALGVVKS
jgi:hypothetical protein